MNPFINLQKRSISLPGGCKELIDVLHGPKPVESLKNTGDKRVDSPKSVDDDAIRRFVHLILVQAHEDHATEVVISAAPADRDALIRYRVKDTWYAISAFPGYIRPLMIAEVRRLADLPAGQFPCEGILNIPDITLGDVHLKWKVLLKSAQDECVLRRVEP